MCLQISLKEGAKLSIPCKLLVLMLPSQWQIQQKANKSALIDYIFGGRSCLYIIGQRKPEAIKKIQSFNLNIIRIS